MEEATMAAVAMKAAVRERWGAPERVVELAEVPKPELESDQVLVHVRAASINRGDFYACSAPGFLLRPMIGGLRRPKERALGGDFAGVVEAVGSDVTDFAPGDEVFGSRSGAFAEYVAARMIARKPANVSFEEAACVPVSALTALQALRDHGGLKPGGRVLVNGASGSVGPFAVQMAKALGAETVTAVCSTRNVEQTRALGADRVVDYTREDFTRSGERYDVIVDIGGSTSWRRLKRVLAPAGVVAVVGSQKQGISSPLIGPLGHVFRLKLAGRKRVKFFIANFNRPDMEVLRGLLESGAIKPVIERIYRFEELPAALAYMGEGHARAKLVVTV
jgi:NADPH:quinone reductase-like Zn-dependent oxidoreductase